MQYEEGSRWKATLLGLGTLLIFSLIAIAALGFLYKKFLQPPPLTVSLSAYFVDDAGAVVVPSREEANPGHESTWPS